MSFDAAPDQTPISTEGPATWMSSPTAESNASLDNVVNFFSNQTGR